MKNVIPKNGCILVSFKEKSETKGGIILPDLSEKECELTVLKKAKGVDNVEIGDKVLVQVNNIAPIKMTSKEVYYFIHKDHVLGVYK